MKAQPLISVVMPVYNAERYLLDAVASILQQSFSDWELICVDDGCTDGSAAILNWFASQDNRVRVVHQKNSGIVGALNRGCETATAPLIARMDADDVALPTRLEWQLNYLRKNAKCVAVGGSILEIDADGDRLGISSLPTGHTEIENNLLKRRTGHYHPTVLMRSEAFHAVGGYRSQYQWVEDHDLWLRLAQRGELANLSDVVLAYRQHASSVCWQRSQQQRELMNNLLREAYQQRNLELPAHLHLTHEANRTPANPGKWARAAAKGGYPRTVIKHLRRLASLNGVRDFYFLRMVAECLARLAGGFPKRLLHKQMDRIPDFNTWHQRFTTAQQSIRKVA
jgi:glycosyltransferase involved in cell wall biosynthesis